MLPAISQGMFREISTDFDPQNPNSNAITSSNFPRDYSEEILAIIQGFPPIVFSLSLSVIFPAVTSRRFPKDPTRVLPQSFV